MSERGAIFRASQRDQQRHKQQIGKLKRTGRKMEAAVSHMCDSLQREVPKQTQPLCGAATRAGGSCRMKCVQGRKRCRLHGGLSTGPKSEAGREAIAESNRRRALARLVDSTAPRIE